MTLDLVARLCATAAAVGAVLALAVQARAALRARPRSFAAPAGSARRGAVYGFTAAMSPAHKESVRLHPLSFALGLVLHAGVAAALAGTLLAAAGAAVAGGGPRFLAGVAAGGAAAAAALLARRATDRTVRANSVPEDVLAALAVLAFLALSAAGLAGALPRAAWLFAAAAFFVYVPLGKLRHAAFFFVARGDLYARLGGRGVVPGAARGAGVPVTGREAGRVRG